MAAQENHVDIVKYLLANGALPSVATEVRFTCSCLKVITRRATKLVCRGSKISTFWLQCFDPLVTDDAMVNAYNFDEI